MSKISELLELNEAKKRYLDTLKRCQQNAPSLFREVRAKLELTQVELGDLLVYHFTYISKIENGRLNAGEPILERLGELIKERMDE